MKGKLLQKTTALILVLCMTMVNFLFVATNVVYALSVSEVSIESGKITFDAYFKDKDGNKVYTKEANISEGATLYAKIKLQSGVLKDAKIKIDNANFKLPESISSKYVVGIDNATKEIKLKELNGSYDNDIDLEIPVAFEKQSTIGVDYFDKDNTVSLSGEYKASETFKTVTAQIGIHLNWTEVPEKSGAHIAYAVEKTIKDENKIIVQERFAVSGGNLPRVEDKLNIKVPKINDKEPDTINLLINGKKLEQNLKTNNYNIKTGELEYTNSFVKDNQINWGTGTDTYKVIYIFENVENIDSVKNITRDVNAVKVTSKVFQYEKSSMEMTCPKEARQFNFNNGNIVSVDAQSKSKNVYKGFMYANSSNGTTYKENYNIEVSDISGISKVELKFDGDKFKAGEANIDTNNQTLYKKVSVDWDKASQILGSEGTIKITDGNGTVKEINASTEKEVALNAHSITVATSAPIKEGQLTISATKQIVGDAGLSKEAIQSLTAIETTVKATTNKDNNGSAAVATTELKEPTTKPAKLSLSQDVFSTKNVNNVEFKVKLETGTPDTYLFKEPVITLQLPEDVAQISNVSAKALFAEKNELKIEQDKITVDGNKIIIPIKGEQTVFDNQTVGGIVVTINAQIKIDVKDAEVEKDTELPITKVAKVVMSYTNENAATQPEPISADVTIDIQKQDQEPTTNEQGNATKTPENKTNSEPTQTVEEKTDKIKVTMSAVSAGVDLKDGDQINAGQTVTYTYIVENLTNNNLENVKLTVNHDGTAKIYEDVTEKDDLQKDFTAEKLTDKTSKVFDLQTILPKAKAEPIVYQVRANEDATELKSKATVSAKDVDSVIINKTNKVKQAELELELRTSIPKEYSSEKNVLNQNILTIKNKTSELLENVEVTVNIPEEYTVSQLAAYGENSDDFVISKEKTNKNTLTFIIKKLAAKNTKQYRLALDMKEANPTRESVTYSYSAQVKENTYYSNEVTVNLSKKPTSSLQVGQVAYVKEGTENNTTKDTVKTGDEVVYAVAIKNVGTSRDIITITDAVPDAAVIQKASYKIGDKTTQIKDIKNNKIMQSVILNPNEVATLTIETKIDEAKTGREEITNKASIIGTLLNKEVTTKETTYKLEANMQKPSTPDTPVNPSEDPVKPNPGEDPQQPTDVVTTKNSISGIAWVDTNKNGIRESGEKVLPELKVMLINTKTNKFVTDENGSKLEAKTDSNGKYIFENIEEGSYMVVFVYDNLKYRNTEYQVTSASENTNSDIITGTISTDSNSTIYAMTDKLELKDKSLEHIDAGFIENEIFDLKLNKYISKITVQNSSGTVVKQYNKEQLAKVEIDAKLLASSTVLVEYTLEVKNEGELAGYANEIVDYMPKEMSFSSEINKDWYKSTDGNVHTTALAKEIINPGETKQVVLTLTKAMTENNTGVTTNKAEITKSSNELSIPDKDTEDNSSTAEVIVSIRTGIEFTIGIIIAIIAITTTGIVVYTKKRKEASHE